MSEHDEQGCDIWLSPTPLDDAGAPLRVATRVAKQDLDAVNRAPVVGPVRMVDGVETAEVTFVYKEPDDRAVMVHLNGLTDGHRTDIRPALLDRITGTDWYALTYLLPVDGTWSYRYVVKDHIRHDVGATRAGWLHMHRAGQSDPLNTDRLRHPHGEMSSVFRGPQAPRRDEYAAAHEASLAKDAPSSSRGRAWQTAPLTDGSELRAHFSPSDHAHAPLLVLFDAEQILTMPLLEALSNYTHPLNVVTLDSGTPEQRGEVLPDAERAAARLKATLQVLAAQFGRRYEPGDVIVSGVSYGGLASANLVVHHPELTQRAVAQSPSFWFDPERELRRDETEPGSLTRYVQEHHDLSNRQIIVHVGTDEGTMGAQAKLFTAAARKAGINVHARQYRGGHDWAWWSHALFDGLDEIFATRGPLL